MLSIAASFTLVCIYLGALLVKFHNDLQVNFAAYVGARLRPEDVFDTVIATLSFRSVDTIILIMILFTLFVLAVVLCTLGRQL